MAEGIRQEKTSPKRELAGWAVSLTLAVVLAMAMHTWVGQLVMVEGPSMRPTLVSGEAVVAGKLEYHFTKPKRGDIVIVRYPGSNSNYIKRVIATGGEHVVISSGEIYIDGKKLIEPNRPELVNTDMEETAVPVGTVFVMGDNRNDSTDSRSPLVGPIPLNHVVGRVYALVWPLESVQSLSGYAGKLEQ